MQCTSRTVHINQTPSSVDWADDFEEWRHIQSFGALMKYLAVMLSGGNVAIVARTLSFFFAFLLQGCV